MKKLLNKIIRSMPSKKQLNKKSLPDKAKKLYKFSNLYWVSRGENFEPKILIAEKAVNHQFF